MVRSGFYFLVYGFFQLVHAGFIQNILAYQKHLQTSYRVALCVFVALGVRTVEPLVIGKRMRIRPRHVSVHHRWAVAGTNVIHGAFACRVGSYYVSAITFFQQQVGEIADQLRNASARGLHFHRNRDRIAVVFNQEQDRQLEIAG